MILSLFKKKAKSILNEEDKKELRELNRQEYMKEARILIIESAKDQAKKDFKIKSSEDF